MVDAAASVLARLKNKAIESGRSNQLCLQLFCQEEFLRRLQRSRFSENFILKGGLLIYAVTDFDSRVTVDIDFLLHNIENTPETLRSIIYEIITSDTGNNFISFELLKTEPISLMKIYPGIRATIIARIKNTRTVFNIDFSVGDVIVPKHEIRKIPTQLEGFESPSVNTYSLETTIAEKLDAILSLMEFSSRMKDYFDIFFIAHRFDFDGQILCNAISKTFKNRNRNYADDCFDHVIEFNVNVAMNEKWVAFMKKANVRNISFEEVIRVINVFLHDITDVAILGNTFTGHWNASGLQWVQNNSDDSNNYIGTYH